jgi:hypothetical protein
MFRGLEKMTVTLTLFLEAIVLSVRSETFATRSKFPELSNEPKDPSLPSSKTISHDIAYFPNQYKINDHMTDCFSLGLIPRFYRYSIDFPALEVQDKLRPMNLVGEEKDDQLVFRYSE